MYIYIRISIYTYERPPKPPTFWNSHTRTLILDTIMKLSGTIGVTQKTMTFDTHVCLILLHTLNPQEQWGTHKNRWPFQPRPFADVIGLVRCSYIYIHIYTVYTHNHYYFATHKWFIFIMVNDLVGSWRMMTWSLHPKPFHTSPIFATMFTVREGIQ